MINSRDLWKLEFLSDYLECSIKANEKVAAEQNEENDHTRGIAFGLRLANDDLIKAKKQLDEQLEILKFKAVSPYMIDDLTYEESGESA